MAADSISMTSFVPIASAGTQLTVTASGDPSAGDFQSLLDERMLTLAGAAVALDTTNESASEASTREPQEPVLPAPAKDALETPALDPFLSLSVPAFAPIASRAVETSAKSAGAVLDSAASSSATIAMTLASGLEVRDSGAADAPLPRDGQATKSLPAFAATPSASERTATLPADSRLTHVALADARLAAATLPDLPLAFARSADLSFAVAHLPEREGQDGVDTASMPAASPAPAPASLHTAPAKIELPQAIASPAWADALGERLVFVARDGAGSAELHVHAAELGPISVRIDLRGDQASIVFGAAHADARNALEAALPRLAESFAAQGLALAHAHVGAQLARDGGAQEFLPRSSELNGTRAEERAIGRVVEVTRRMLGIVDTFA